MSPSRREFVRTAAAIVGRFAHTTALGAAFAAAACSARSGPTPSPAQQTNPIVRQFLADPSAHVFNDRVYVYLTNDSANSGTYWNANDWRLLSSADLVRWQDHGTLLTVSAFQWAHGLAWAPSAAERNGTFFLYVPMDRTKIGVASASDPAGPFHDARGEPLIDKARDANTGAEPIDPMVFVDHDGQAYMYFGTRTPKVVRLAPDMIHLSGEIMDVKLDRSNYGEAPWLHERNGTYYFTYSTGWPGQLVYATGTTPLGPFAYRGIVLDYTNISTNHGAIVQFKGDWYLFYHNASLPGSGNYRRSTNMNRLYYEDDGSIRQVIPTGGGNRPPKRPNS